MPQAPKESGHSISSERTSTTSCRRLQRRTAVRWRSRCCSVGRRKRRSGPWTLGSELIANVVRVDYSTHVAAPANRQLRPHVLALLASSRRRLGGPIVRRLLRESLNAGHRHGSPNAWAAMQSSCPADYILQGQFGQEAVRRGEQLGRTSTSRIGPYSTGDLGSRLTLRVTASAISMSLRFERRASSRSISNAR